MQEQGSKKGGAIAAAAKAAEPPAHAGDDDLDLRLSKFPTDDIGNAQRLIARHGRDIIYVYGRGWLCWDGKRWHRDKSGMRIQRLAHKTARSILNEVLAAQRDGTEEKPFLK